MAWLSPLKSLVDLFGADSPGAQPYNTVVPYVVTAATLTALPASGGSLPSRPFTTASPSSFIFGPSANLTTGVSYIAQLPTNTTGTYLPGDYVRFRFTLAQLGGNSVMVETATANPIEPALIYQIQYASANITGGGAYVDIQLNAAGSQWVFIGAAYF